MPDPQLGGMNRKHLKMRFYNPSGTCSVARENAGDRLSPYEQLLCVLTECIHNGALIIDDIEDDSLLRRGDTTIHLRYGVDVAINAGNTLYFLPPALVQEHPQLTDEQ